MLRFDHIGCFTALVGVALHDQSVPGRGQLALVRGVHEEVEALFRRQRAAGGPVGAGGAGWPRLVPLGEDGAAPNGLPEAVRRAASHCVDSAGYVWAEPTQLFLEEGDAVIALQATPHAPTLNFGPDLRMTAYFRLRRFRPENPHEGNPEVKWGLSDHPDRGFHGKFLEYPPSYDPWRTSIDRLCDHWSEWDGMRQLASEERAKLANNVDNKTSTKRTNCTLGCIRPGRPHGRSHGRPRTTGNGFRTMEATPETTGETTDNGHRIRNPITLPLALSCTSCLGNKANKTNTKPTNKQSKQREPLG